jgi:membrane protease YdiL (CAAX protease family)
VILAPITEELLFRGLIFRSLFDRSKVLAYLVSMCLFSFIHLTNYIGYLDIQWLGLAFLEYLPAAYCLAFAYHNSGSILSPMLVHALVNMLSIGLF